MINLQVPAKGEMLRPTITVVGVGGAGGNAVNNMISSQLEGVNFVVANTDAQAVDFSLTERTIQLGANITRGLGAGANPDIGRAAAEEAREEIASHIEGSNMVFITAGMGGGTGTGAAPVVARIAKDMGILTVAVVTKPFQFEGHHRMRLAEAGLKELQDYVDTLIVIPNQNLFRLANERTTFADAFKMADEVLHSGVRGVTDLMIKPGMINLDFADLSTVMREMGKAMMGTGEAIGERRAIEAAEAAISNPLLDDISLKGARALLVNITGGMDMTLFEVDEAMNRIRDEVDSEANIIFGSTFNSEMEGKMRVSVVATGIDVQAAQQPKITPMQEQKRPFSFAPSPVTKTSDFRASAPIMRAEPVKPAFTPAPAPARADVAAEPAPVVMQQFAQPQAPVVKEELFAEELSDTPMFAPREPASAMASAPVSTFAAEPRFVAAAPARTESVVQDDEEHEASHGRGFFKRVADVGRVLSSRADRAEVAERIQVVQKSPQVEARPHVQQTEEEQYLDIPAFLRRQAN
jgi:cell division protein FtsZ